MSEPETLLKVLLERRRWAAHRTFTAEYDRAAKAIDPRLVGGAPSRAQLHRWVTGQVTKLPYEHNCRVLEAMFAGWTAEQLFAPPPADLPDEPLHRTPGDVASRDHAQHHEPALVIAAGKYADLQAVYTSRTEFAADVTPASLFDNARDIRILGLSLNILCQSYPDQKIRRLLESGTTITCVFLDPKGQAIRDRAIEESLPENHLADLTDVNIHIMKRLRSKLSPAAQERFTLATYEAIPRVNVTLIDDEICVAQPYLPDTRGLDSPTFLIRRQGDEGLYFTYSQVYDTIRDGSTEL